MEKKEEKKRKKGNSPPHEKKKPAPFSLSLGPPPVKRERGEKRREKEVFFLEKGGAARPSPPAPPPPHQGKAEGGGKRKGFWFCRTFCREKKSGVRFPRLIRGRKGWEPRGVANKGGKRNTAAGYQFYQNRRKKKKKKNRKKKRKKEKVFPSNFPALEARGKKKGEKTANWPQGEKEKGPIKETLRNSPFLEFSTQQGRGGKEKGEKRKGANFPSRFFPQKKKEREKTKQTGGKLKRDISVLENGLGRKGKRKKKGGGGKKKKGPGNRVGAKEGNAREVFAVQLSTRFLTSQRQEEEKGGGGVRKAFERKGRGRGKVDVGCGKELGGGKETRLLNRNFPPRPRRGRKKKKKRGGGGGGIFRGQGFCFFLKIKKRGGKEHGSTRQGPMERG